MRNVRISITDLIEAARVLHEFRVVAAGFMYATLELDGLQRMTLSANHIDWSFDGR